MLNPPHLPSMIAPSVALRRKKQALAMSRSFWMLGAAALATAACNSRPPSSSTPDGGVPEGSTPPPPDVMQPPPPADVVHPADYFCDLPGSVRHEATGVTMVPGGQ